VTQAGNDLSIPFQVDFSAPLSESQIASLIKNEELDVIQIWADDLDAENLDKLNRRFFPRRPDVPFRVWGGRRSADLTPLSRLTNVRHLVADCIQEATGVESVTSLRNLESLSIGVFSLKDLGFLNDVVPTITRLSLGWTRSKRPDLNSLGRFKSLRTVSIEGHSKNIEVLGSLKKLENVTLRSVTTPSLEFLADLPALWSLDIKLGGTNNLSALKGNSTLKYLELWQVSGLKDISVVSTLKSLQYLFLQALRNITAIPDLSRLKRLRRVHLEDLRGLTDISGVASAPALEEFIHFWARRQAPADYASLLQSRTLRKASVKFGSLRKNREFDELREGAGISAHDCQGFHFR
jgi:hypothetical protein